MNSDPLDAQRLGDPEYFAEQVARFTLMGEAGKWFVECHSHQCEICKVVITHTGLQATRGGDAAHMCCGRDVRGSVHTWKRDDD